MKTYLLFLSLLSLSCKMMDGKKGNGDIVKENFAAGKDIFIENKDIDQEIDFTLYAKDNLMSVGISQVKTVASVTFKDCKFKKRVAAFRNDAKGKKVIMTHFLSNLSFINCRFEEDFDFRGVTVAGKTDFSNSIFYKKVNLEEASFGGNAYFNNGSFEEEVRFQNSFFQQKANFMNTKFDKVASFQSAVFNHELQFSSSRFKAYADFSLIECHARSFFNYTDFQKKAVFSNANFSNDVQYVGAKFNIGEWHQVRFLGASSFVKCTVEDNLGFKECYHPFQNLDLSHLSANKYKIEK